MGQMLGPEDFSRYLGSNQSPNGTSSGYGKMNQEPDQTREDATRRKVIASALRYYFYAVNHPIPEGDSFKFMVGMAWTLWDGIPTKLIPEACKVAAIDQGTYAPSLASVPKAYRNLISSKDERWVDLGRESQARAAQLLASPEAYPASASYIADWLATLRKNHPFIH